MRAAQRCPASKLHVVDLGVDLGRLTALTRRVAAEVLAGRHEVTINPERRSYRLLRSDDTVDVWLIGRATGRATELTITAIRSAP